MVASRTPGRLRALPDPDPERWVRQGEANLRSPTRAELYPARLTIDVTSELRRRIKLSAVSQGVTVAELLRAVLEREFPHVKAGE